VTLIDKRDRLLPFVDHEIVDEFCHHLRETRVTLRLNESVGGLEIIEDEHGPRVRLHLDSGKTIIAEKALYSVGRTGATTTPNPAGRPAPPASSIWRRLASRPTTVVAWWSMSTTAPRCPAFTRSAT